MLHGVDIVKKTWPYYPSNFGPADAEFLANEGFTVARIGFIWAGVEPRPGHYDDAYIEKIIALNNLLARYGIHTLIDFHQDDWGETNVYGDGAPVWASLGTSDGQDFEDFWDNDDGPDGVGIQTAYVRAWRHVVPMLDASVGSANILGFDPFNEPYPGAGYPSCGDFSPCPPFEKGPLANFYRHVITAIRSTGDTHVIFPEGIAQNAKEQPSLPAFTDPQTAFNWHYYCLASEFLPDRTGVATNELCASSDATGFSNINAYASRLGVPWIVSEFGASDADAEYAKEIDFFDSHFLSWMYWMYYGYPTDPADTPLESIVISDLLPGSTANSKPLKLNALVVPYAEEIAGTPVSYSFFRASDILKLTYLAAAPPGVHLAAGALTQLFVPQQKYPHGYAIRVSGAKVVTPAASTWVELATLPGALSISVTISPLAGASLP